MSDQAADQPEDGQDIGDQGEDEQMEAQDPGAEPVIDEDADNPDGDNDNKPPGEEGDNKEGEEGEPKDGEEGEPKEDVEPKEGEEPPVPVDIPAEMIKLRDQFKEGLTQLSRTADNSSFAFAHLDTARKEIENLYDVLKSYPHVRYFLVNENKLKSIEGVIHMHSLLLLDASQNEIKTAKFLGQSRALSHLQSINLSQNKIRVLEGLVLPRLRKLVLDENEIKSLEHIHGHKNLQSLSVKKNKLKNLKGLDNMDRLEELYLSENEIKTWEGLGPLKSLNKLVLNLNQISQIPEDLPILPKLKELDISENKLKDFKQMPRLLGFKYLTDISLATNPFEEELGGDARKQLILSLCVTRVPTIHYSRLISVVNKEPFGEEEQTAVLEELIQQAEEERIKKAEEEEEKRLKEEEEKRLKEEEDREKREKEEEEKRIREEEEKERNAKDAEEKERLAKEAEDNPQKGEKEQDNPPADAAERQSEVEPPADEAEGEEEQT